MKIVTAFAAVISLGLGLGATIPALAADHATLTYAQCAAAYSKDHQVAGQPQFRDYCPYGFPVPAPKPAWTCASALAAQPGLATDPRYRELCRQIKVADAPALMVASDSATAAAPVQPAPVEQAPAATAIPARHRARARHLTSF